MRTLRILLLQITTLLVLFLVAISSGYAEPFGFISMADSRGVNNGVNDAVLSSIIDLVVHEDAQFVLFPGDLVNGSSDASTLASQLSHWRDIMAPIYSSDMYGAKVYAGPGNHEIRDSASEGTWQSIFGDLPSNGPVGETYMTYSFDYLNAHFVMLNSNRAGSPHTVNYDWLADDLAGTTADHIFVFAHEPAYPAGPHLGSSLDSYPEERDAFWQLLVDHDVDIYFAGHEHLYNHVEIEGVHQVIAGTCGAPIYSGYGGDFYHYALITVDGPYVSVNVFDDNSVMRDSFQFGQPDCSDGIDNDKDGLSDYPDDPGCQDAADLSEESPLLPCDDGIDNDGDGWTDFDPFTFAHPGDETTPPSGSGDPGCNNPLSATESPQCQDGVDNDGDGTMDYDGGLSALGYVAAEPDFLCFGKPWTNLESTYCGLGAELALLLPPLMWMWRRRRA